MYTMRAAKKHGDPSGFFESLQKIASNVGKYRGLTLNDRKYTRYALHPELMKAFRYEYAPLAVLPADLQEPFPEQGESSVWKATKTASRRRGDGWTQTAMFGQHQSASSAFVTKRVYLLVALVIYKLLRCIFVKRLFTSLWCYHETTLFAMQQPYDFISFWSSWVCGGCDLNFWSQRWITRRRRTLFDNLHRIRGKYSCNDCAQRPKGDSDITGIVIVLQEEESVNIGDPRKGWHRRESSMFLLTRQIASMMTLITQKRDANVKAVLICFVSLNLMQPGSKTRITLMTPRIMATVDGAAQ
jgi:hypothetical protein